MRPIVLLAANGLSLLATLIINYTAGIGALAKPSVGEVSDQYPTLITPAGYAFSIWGLIYLLLIAFTAYQWFCWKKEQNDESLQATGLWFTLANIANGLWVLAWINEALGFSVLLMFILLFCLVRLVVRLKLETWDAPLRTIAFVWWPICIYTGWIVLATVVNVAVHMESLNVLGELLYPSFWAIAVLLVTALIYGYLVWARNMREAALVGVWGLIAISYNQWGKHDSVAITALLASVVLLSFAGYHGWKNKATSPLAKWQAREI